MEYPCPGLKTPDTSGAALSTLRRLPSYKAGSHWRMSKESVPKGQWSRLVSVFLLPAARKSGVFSGIHEAVIP